MDNSCSDADVSLSPSQILDRLQVLRQLQILQRGKLQKQRLDYLEPPDASSNMTEIVSHFSSSTSYNTFRSLLQISHDKSSDEAVSDRMELSSRLQDKDLIDGVAVLNLSKESQSINNSLSSTTSRTHSESEIPETHSKTQINIDDMLLPPKKDFKNLLMEKLQADNSKPSKTNDLIQKDRTNVGKRTFLRRGEGMSRFGLKKNDLIIQTTNSLPWKKGTNTNRPVQNTKAKNKQEKNHNQENKKNNKQKKNSEKVSVQFTIPELKIDKSADKLIQPETPQLINRDPKQTENIVTNSTKPLENLQMPSLVKTLQKPEKHPLVTNKGKTWAAILTKEQDDFLKQLKQSEYYKNFASPAKSTMSDVSCDEVHRASLEREHAEQNLFELLENKVNNRSFNLENSFFNKLLGKKQLECSGESTPLVFQKCLKSNPELLHIYPVHNTCAPEDHTQTETDCEYMDCDHETCSSASTCCSCKTVEETQIEEAIKPKVKPYKITKEVKNVAKENLDDTVTDKDELKTNIVEMNAKLLATSDLLKERLRELEDEIETFRKENANLTKMREDIDLERQKFYEEKSTFEQKYNEEKVLAEYYLAEEKEKLSKQKQTYERYVREMRGRLNKKDKEEVVLLKKEINDLKEEIRLKDAKTTTTIARLRNQIKIIEKEKKDLEGECEKLKRENRRIIHSNDTTRRLTNIKYLEEINRKLSSMSARESRTGVVHDDDMKYRSYEIETQSRSVKDKLPARKRAKSVPNLNVTSRYAKYFSQRDTASEIEQHSIVSVEKLPDSGDFRSNTHELHLDLDNSDSKENNDSEEENNLERIYTDRFRNTTPDHDGSVKSGHSARKSTDSFFLRKSTSNNSISNSDRLTPVSILSNHKKSPINNTINTSNSSNISNPVEYKKPDGSRELRFPNGNVKHISSDGKYSKFVYYNGDIKETFYTEGRIKYYYAENKTYHTTYSDGLEVLEFPDGQIEKRYRDGSSEIRLPNGSVRYCDPKRDGEEWRFPDGTVLTVSGGEQVVRFPNGQREVHSQDHKRREFPDGTVKLVYSDGTSETRYSSGRVRIKDKHGHLILDSNPS